MVRLDMNGLNKKKHIPVQGCAKDFYEKCKKGQHYFSMKKNSQILRDVIHECPLNRIRKISKNESRAETVFENIRLFFMLCRY